MDTISANVIIIVPFVGFMSYDAMLMLSIETWVCDENLEEKQKFYGDRRPTLIQPPDAQFSPSHQVSPPPRYSPTLDWSRSAGTRLSPSQFDGARWLRMVPYLAASVPKPKLELDCPRLWIGLQCVIGIACDPCGHHF